MGFSYNHHTMVGAFISGRFKDVYIFLEKNGYSLTDEQKEEIEEYDDIVDVLKLEGMSIINLNSWSGHDYVIGYHVGKESETEEYAKKFAKKFPNVKAKYHDFTEVS